MGWSARGSTSRGGLHWGEGLGRSPPRSACGSGGLGRHPGVCIQKGAGHTPPPPELEKRAVRILLECFLVTARKRSLGQGNIFRNVCQEFCPRGGEYLGRYPPQEQVHPLEQVHPRDQVPPWEQVYPPGPGTPAPHRTRYIPRDQVHPRGAVHAGRYGQQAGCTHPTGMHSCLTLDLFLRKMHQKEIFKSANDVDLYPKVSDSVSSCRLRSACI